MKKPAAKKELVRKRPMGKYFEILEDTISAGEHRKIVGEGGEVAAEGCDGILESTPVSVNLENFEKFEGKRINSPVSIATLKMFGVLENDLLPKTYQYFLELSGGDDAVAKMKHAFEDRTRGRLIDKLRDERWRALRKHSQPSELASRARDAPVEGSPPYSSAGSSPAAANASGQPHFAASESPTSPHSLSRTGVRTAAMEMEAVRRLAEGVSVRSVEFMGGS